MGQRAEIRRRALYVIKTNMHNFDTNSNWDHFTPESCQYIIDEQLRKQCGDHFGHSGGPPPETNPSGLDWSQWDGDCPHGEYRSNCEEWRRHSRPTAATPPPPETNPSGLDWSQWDGDCPHGEYRSDCEEWRRHHTPTATPPPSGLDSHRCPDGSDCGKWRSNPSTQQKFTAKPQQHTVSTYDIEILKNHLLRYLEGIGVLRRDDYNGSQTPQDLAASFAPTDTAFCDFGRIRFPLDPLNNRIGNADEHTMILVRKMETLVNLAEAECRCSLYGPLSMHFLNGVWTMKGPAYHGSDHSHEHMLQWFSACQERKGLRWAVVWVSLHAVEINQQWDHQIAVVIDLSGHYATVFDPNGATVLPDYPSSEQPGGSRVSLFEVFVNGAGATLFPQHNLTWVRPFSSPGTPFETWDRGLQAWVDQADPGRRDDTPFWCSQAVCGTCSRFRGEHLVQTPTPDTTGLCTAITILVHLVCTRFGYFDMAHMAVLIREVMQNVVEQGGLTIEQARMVLRRRIIDWVLQVYALSEIGEEHNKKQRFLELLSGGLWVCAAMSEHGTCREWVLQGSIRCAKHATRKDDADVLTYKWAQSSDVSRFR